MGLGMDEVEAYKLVVTHEGKPVTGEYDNIVFSAEAVNPRVRELKKEWDEIYPNVSIECYCSFDSVRHPKYDYKVWTRPEGEKRPRWMTMKVDADGERLFLF